MASIKNFKGLQFAETVDWHRYQWALLESPWDTRLCDLRPNPNSVTAPTERPAVETYSSGVLFGADCELRWRKMRNGQFHCVIIDDSPEGALRPLGRRTEVLWGEPDGDIWWETRIPREIADYPAELRGRRVALEFVEYEFEPDANEPPVVLTRMAGFHEAAASLQPTQEEEKA